MARQPALALDAFEHRRLFAADIGAGAAPQMDFRVRRKARGFDLGDLDLEQRADLRVFVAQVDVDVLRLDRPRAQQHAFEEAVRIGLEEIAILEGAGLALVGVDRHEARRRLGAHQRPFAPGGETRAAETAQRRVLERLHHRLHVAPIGEAIGEQAIAAAAAVVVELGIRRDVRMRVALGERGRDRGEARVLLERMAERRYRRVVAAAHAGRPYHPHARAHARRQLRQQLLRTQQRAGQAIAHAHRHGRRRRLAVHDDVEMGIERCNLVHLDERQLHLVGERREMAGVEAAILVLQQVQVLDQQVALRRLLAQERQHLVERFRLDLAAARQVAAAAAAGAGMDAAMLRGRGRHGGLGRALIA